ncbi:heparinase II/III domain-containing protein [Dysgonomonas reticulitermitis]
MKKIQLFYQVYYKLKRKKAFNNYLPKECISFNRLYFKNEIISKEIILDRNHFTFLNLEKKFEKEIDWNFSGYGKLWYYNLQYFDFLFQENISDEIKIDLIKDYNIWLADNKTNLESYPIALRVINGIRFFSDSGRKINQQLIDSYYAQLNFLYDNLEYQILGNHLLENAFAIFMGGYAFNNPQWQKKGKNILQEEVKEQILHDGAHFELSPMYHKIILFRLIELIDWYSNTTNLDTDFLNFIKSKAIKMINWLYSISLWEYNIPHFNDSADHITYSNEQIYHFAKNLNLMPVTKTALNESGYRKFSYKNYQSIVDIGKIGAPYQPGHAHADALSFILHYKKKPIFVEVGTSTYQIGSSRNYERSTKAHNTVVVNNKNQSEVWAGFRVGNRANVYIEKDLENILTAFHDGYQKYFSIIHRREFIFEENSVCISDSLVNSSRKEYIAEAYFHFHPKVHVELKDRSSLFLDNSIKLNFENSISISLIDYNFAERFNVYNTGKVVKVSFYDYLKTTIILN